MDQLVKVQSLCNSHRGCFLSMKLFLSSRVQDIVLRRLFGSLNCCQKLALIWRPNMTDFLGKMFLPTHVKSKNKKSLTSEPSGFLKGLRQILRAQSPEQASKMALASLLKTLPLLPKSFFDDISSSFFFFSKCNLERVKLDIIMICQIVLLHFTQLRQGNSEIDTLIEVCQIWKLGFWIESRLTVGVVCLWEKAIAQHKDINLGRKS